MEGVSKTVYEGLRGYWRRKGYEKLNGQQGRRRLGRGRRRLRFSWRIKIKRKLKIMTLPHLLYSPKKFVIWLRDAYMKMMMRFANSRICASASAGYGGIQGFGEGPLPKEYDEKAIVEIYKSLALAQAQAQLAVPRDAPSLASQSSRFVSPALID